MTPGDHTTDFLRHLARHRFTHFSQADLIRIFECVFEAYSVDANYIDSSGSPLILYAIQSNEIPIIKFLIERGARLTENGKGVYNKKYQDQCIDIPHCLKYRGSHITGYVQECVYKEMLNC